MENDACETCNGLGYITKDISTGCESPVYWDYPCPKACRVVRIILGVAQVPKETEY